MDLSGPLVDLNGSADSREQNFASVRCLDQCKLCQRYMDIDWIYLNLQLSLLHTGQRDEKQTLKQELDSAPQWTVQSKSNLAGTA